MSPFDTAILYLTSGATGEPKMALVTHQSVVANIDMGPAALPVGAKDVLVSRTSSRIDIKVKYTVPIATPVYTYNWSLDESLSAPLF